MKKYFKYFIYLSILFLVIFLIRNEAIRNIEIRRWHYLYLSIPLLFLGFCGQAVQWRAILIVKAGKMSLKDAFISTGLTIFGKYIPGKVWVIIGRAAYVSDRAEIPMKDVSWISMVSQAFTLWIGLVIGGGFILLDGSRPDYSMLIVGGAMLMAFLIFSKRLLSVVQRLIKRVLKKEIRLPHMSLKEMLVLSPYYLATWLFWSGGFYLISLSVIEQDLSPYALSVFPVAASLGIMAIIVPGGLGVREGILVGLLVMFGVEMKYGIVISVVQRLWFLFGEAFIFFVALFLNNWKLGFDKK